MKEKSKYGQYFTIDPIAKFMVSLIRHSNTAKVLEPSCGKGVFLHHLEESGFNRIDAYEIDKSIGNPYNYVKYESFVTSPLDKYDVVIGNPPYIRWKNLENELKKELSSSRLWNTYFNSLCDYLFIFILKSIEQLNENGELIFICTEYWMNTTHSETLRDYMAEHGFISEIYHFKEAPLFEGVCASFIIFHYVKSKKKNPQITLYQYNHGGSPEFDELCAKSCFNTVSIPQFEIGRRWLLATKEQQESLKSFEKHCRVDGDDLFSSTQMNRIGDFCDIGNGMVSGLDKAFNVTDITELNDAEKASMIKVLKAKDLDYYCHNTESRYFFIREHISEHEFIERYPAISKHISAYKEGLDERYDYGKNTNFWEFVFPRNYNLFSRNEKRIMVPCKERISNKNHFRFVLAQSNYYPLQDVTAILKKDKCKESIEYLLAYLNNRRVFEWLGFNGIVKGYIIEFSEAPIASIPYRTIDWSNPDEVKAHDVITNAVKDYLHSKNDIYNDIINNTFNKLFA